MKKMLLVFAHPDDESFAVGGTVVKYAKAGWDIHLICATNGEAGNNAVNESVRGSELGEIRKKELEQAGKILGISSIEFLGFPDGRVKQTAPGTIEDMLTENMKAWLPDIVMTYDTTGMSNHPDHTKISFATTYAFQRYAAYLESLKDPISANKGRGKIWKQAEYTRAFSDVTADTKEPKLFYAVMPKSVVTYLIKEKQIPEESWGKPWVGIDDKLITTVIDISKVALLKGKALLCHETQGEKVDQFISFVGNPLVKKEYFILRMQGIYEVFMGKTDRVSDSLLSG